MDEEFDQWSSSWENKISGLRNSSCDSIKKWRQRQDGEAFVYTELNPIQVLMNQWLLLLPLTVLGMTCNSE